MTKIQARLAASLLALTFFLFVVLMDAPGLARNPQNRFALALMLRELAFCGGPLALAASLSGEGRGSRVFATIARYFVAIPVLVYSIQQFMHGDHVPGVPLEPLTPTWILGHAIWTYVAAVGYAIGGVLLLIGKKTRAAATWVGLTVLFVETCRLCAHCDRRTRQPRQGPELFRGYADVLRHRSSARRSHAARRVASLCLLPLLTTDH